MNDFDLSTAFASYLCRARSTGSIKSALNTLRLRYGDLFFYYPTLVSFEKVFIVFDTSVASLILNNNVLFTRLEEQWHSRHDSIDLYERLLGDGLFFADGYHHRKRVSLLQSRIASPGAWDILESYLIPSLDTTPFDVSGAQISILLLTHVLEAFYNVSLKDETLDLLLPSIAQAWELFQKQSSCPFGLRKKRSSRRSRRIIDSARQMLRSQLDEVTECKTFSLDGTSISLTNLSLVDEVMIVAFSTLSKLPNLLDRALEYGRSLDIGAKECLARELDNSVASPSRDCVAKSCPETYKVLANLLSASCIPFDFLKRVNICETTVEGIEVPRSTEIWIPAWNCDPSMIFGLGSYDCKGRDLSLALVTRILQWDCRRQLS